MEFTVINANINDLASTSEDGDRNLTSDSVELAQLDPQVISNLGESEFQTENNDNSIHVVLVNDSGLNLTGSANDDNLYGSENSDVLSGKDGKDLLEGRQGNDTLYGGRGSDTLQGGAGNDALYGGKGLDTVIESGNIDFTLSNSQLKGRGMDTIGQIEFAELSGGADDNLIDASSATRIKTKLMGNRGNDTLMGSQMNDSIYGGAGKDIIHGGMGEDLLVGNGGADIFALEPAMDRDLIADFQDGMDKFGLSNSLGFSDLSITNNPKNTATLIADATNENELLAVVNNIDAADLTAADFTTI